MHKILTRDYLNLGRCELLSVEVPWQQPPAHPSLGQCLCTPNGLGGFPHSNCSLFVFKYFCCVLCVDERVVAEVKLGKVDIM